LRPGATIEVKDAYRLTPGDLDQLPKALLFASGAGHETVNQLGPASL